MNLSDYVEFSINAGFNAYRPYFAAEAIEGRAEVRGRGNVRLRVGGCRGATTDEKLRGTKVWVPTLGRPSRCGGPGVSPPENF